MSKNGIITFIRNPELGKVKTRIAATEGPEKALAIYCALLEHTKRVVSNIEATRFLFYHENINVNDGWDNTIFQKCVQVDGNLGKKMAAAFLECSSTCEKVIIIGSDCASLSQKHIEAAFDALAHSDFVIGPTYDGGYYLLGMRTFAPEVFENINWSTETVLNETITKISALNKTYTLIEKLSDIDFIEDWDKWGWKL